MGCLPDCAVVLTFEVDNDDLNNYTILTRGVPKRIGGRDLGDASMIRYTRKDMGS